MRIAVLSDHNLSGSGIAALLREQDGFDVSGPVSHDDWESLVAETAPQFIIVVSSFADPRVEGLIADIRNDEPQRKVVYIGLHDDDDSLMGALRCGAHGALDAHVDKDTLISSIQEIADGEVAISRRAARLLVEEQIARHARLRDNQPSRVLTPRELMILRLISRGESNKGIARELGISEHTVRAHVRTIMRKLEVANRVQAATAALRQGLAAS